MPICNNCICGKRAEFAFDKYANNHSLLYGHLPRDMIVSFYI